MRPVLLLAASVLLSAVPALAPAMAQTRFYGRDGSLQGTARPGPGGETRYYGRDGSFEGSARTR